MKRRGFVKEKRGTSPRATVALGFIPNRKNVLRNLDRKIIRAIIILGNVKGFMVAATFRLRREKILCLNAG